MVALFAYVQASSAVGCFEAHATRIGRDGCNFRPVIHSMIWLESNASFGKNLSSSLLTAFVQGCKTVTAVVDVPFVDGWHLLYYLLGCDAEAVVVGKDILRCVSRFWLPSSSSLRVNPSKRDRFLQPNIWRTAAQRINYHRTH